MPTYAYACKSCSHRFEIVQSFSDASLTECPECNGALRKQYGSIGVTFNGSGFYRTDSRTGSRDSKGSRSSGDKGVGDKGSTSESGSSGGASSGDKGTSSSNASSSPGGAGGSGSGSSSVTSKTTPAKAT